jgi:hypothetical protein
VHHPDLVPAGRGRQHEVPIVNDGHVQQVQRFREALAVARRMVPADAHEIPPGVTHGGLELAEYILSIAAVPRRVVTDLHAKGMEPDMYAALQSSIDGLLGREIDRVMLLGLLEDLGIELRELQEMPVKELPEAPPYVHATAEDIQASMLVHAEALKLAALEHDISLSTEQAIAILDRVDDILTVIEDEDDSDAAPADAPVQ